VDRGKRFSVRSAEPGSNTANSFPVSWEGGFPACERAGVKMYNIDLAPDLMSQRVRKRVEEIFGWVKEVGLMRKTRHRGLDRVGWVFQFNLAAYNLVRMRNLSLAAT
jgi:hypothetical protein